MNSYYPRLSLGHAFRRHPVVTTALVCIYAGVEAVNFFNDTLDVGRRLLRLRVEDDPAPKDRQLARAGPDHGHPEHRHRHESPTDQRRSLWNALRNPLYFLHPASKERRDKRTLASVLPGWYEYYAPATLEALPPRDPQGKRVAFAEVYERTFNPKTPPSMVPSLEETVTCSYREEPALTVPKPPTERNVYMPAPGLMSRTLRRIASSSTMRYMAASQHKALAGGELDVHATGYSLHGDHIRYHLLITSLYAPHGSSILREKPILKLRKRFAEVYALQQTLLADPITRAAAKSVAHLCPPKTYTWCALMRSDSSEGTKSTRVRMIPKYLQHVVNDPAMGKHPAVLAFLGMEKGAAAF